MPRVMRVKNSSFAAEQYFTAGAPPSASPGAARVGSSSWPAARRPRQNAKPPQSRVLRLTNSEKPAHLLP